MISLILVLITFYNYYSCYAEPNKLENVYIDTLIQRYLDEEQLLWNSIYSNYSTDRSHVNVYAILTNIQNTHDQFFRDQYLEYVMSVPYMSRFTNNMDFYNIQSYAEEYQHQVLTKPPEDSYMDIDMTFNVYNYTHAEDLFKAIFESSETATCTTWSTQMESSSQTLYMFYELLSANILTSYMKSQRANMKQVVNNNFASRDYDILRTKFKDMYNDIIHNARKYTRTASRLTWMCDRNATDDPEGAQEVTNFIRGYVDNQINLNSEQSCWGSCSDYKFTRNYGCYNGTFCYEEKKIGEVDPVCRGEVIDCGFIEEEMEFCPSVMGRNRRYEHINYGCTPTHRHRKARCNDEGRYFGQSGNCETKPVTLKPFRNDWLVKCDYCFCYCDEHLEDSDRYFSLQPVVSDVRDNMIVSGVSLMKRNGIFSFRITQSKLLSYGRVQQYQLDKDIRRTVYSDFRRTDPGIINGIDYHTLSWENRSFDLDTLIVPHGSVVTGVQFVVDNGHLSLKIRYTRFDFVSGTLFDQDEWIRHGNSDRENLQIDRPEPNLYYDIYGAYLSVPDFSPKKFVKFRPSDPDKDIGQSTVPFIDIQMVRPKILVPLSGVGIYYKGKPGLGGFIAPSVVVYDMSPHIGNKLLAQNNTQENLQTQ